MKILEISNPLDDFIDEGVEAFLASSDSEEEIETTRFRIDDDSKASWAMAHYRRLKLKENENKMIAEAEIARIEGWLEDVNSSLKNNIDYFTSLLIDYGHTQRESDKRKTIKLPYGIISSKSGSDKWEVDNELFIPWADENAPDLVRIKKEPKMAEIKANLKSLEDGTILTSNGELVPGLVVTPAVIEYKVKHVD